MSKETRIRKQEEAIEKSVEKKAKEWLGKISELTKSAQGLVEFLAKHYGPGAIAIVSESGVGIMELDVEVPLADRTVT